MDLISTLDGYIKKAIERGGRLNTGSTFPDIIDNMVAKTLAGQAGLTSTSLAGRIQARINTLLPKKNSITVKPQTGYLTVTNTSPLTGKLEDGSVAAITVTYQVSIGDVVAYAVNNGIYRVEGRQPGYTKMSVGQDDVPQNIYCKVSDIMFKFPDVKTMDANNSSTVFKALFSSFGPDTMPVLVAQNGKILAFYESGFRVYNEKTSLQTVDLSLYLTPVAGETRRVGKVVEHDSKLYVTIAKLQLTTPPTDIAWFSNEQISGHVWPSKEAYDLLILDSVSYRVLDYKNVPYSSLEHQNTIVGFTDIAINRKLNKVVWLYVDPVPDTTTLTQNTAVISDKDFITGEQLIFTTVQDYLDYRIKLRLAKDADPTLGYDPYALRGECILDGTRTFTLGGHRCSVEVYNGTSTELKDSVLLNQFSVDVAGGMMGALLCMDDVTGDMYVVRNSEAWAPVGHVHDQLTGAIIGELPTGFEYVYTKSTWPNVPDQEKILFVTATGTTGPFNGTCVGLCGYRVYRVDTGAVIAEFGGEHALARSHMKGEPWYPQQHLFFYNPSMAKWSLTGVMDSWLQQNSFEGLMYGDGHQYGYGASYYQGGWTFDQYHLPSDCKGTLASLGFRTDPMLNRFLVLGSTDSYGKPTGARRIIFYATKLVLGLGSSYDDAASSTGMYSLELATGIVTNELVRPAVLRTAPIGFPVPSEWQSFTPVVLAQSVGSFLELNDTTVYVATVLQYLYRTTNTDTAQSYTSTAISAAVHRYTKLDGKLIEDWAMYPVPNESYTGLCLSKSRRGPINGT